MDEMYSREYEALVKYFENSGGDPRALRSSEYASMVINHNRVLHVSEVDGIQMRFERMENGVEVWITVNENVVVKNPVHLCFGMLPRSGRQIIRSHINVGDGSRVKFLSHCIFPKAVDIEHVMDSDVTIGMGASMEYEEVHIHGKSGRIRVVPKAIVNVGPGGYYSSTFVVKTGRAGNVDIDYSLFLSDNSSASLFSKIYGRYNDKIRVKESMYLKGRKSRGIIKTRMVLRDRSSSEVIGEVVGIGDDSRGHVDCMEVILDDATARASPIVYARNPKAKVTHEAAIGSVDKKQLLTLMSRGLSEEESIDVIVGGLLR